MECGGVGEVAIHKMELREAPGERLRRSRGSWGQGSPRGWRGCLSGNICGGDEGSTVGSVGPGVSQALPGHGSVGW